MELTLRPVSFTRRRNYYLRVESEENAQKWQWFLRLRKNYRFDSSTTEGYWM